jgi:hypothetical protein
MNTPSPRPARKRSPDEPELTQEESVPLDGTDPEGEEMRKKVENKMLEDRGDAERKTERKTPGKT